ncbi:EamA family transporter [Novosphingobium pentaromativorans]|uniref:EamA domain-containing protein n=1 Tax=Novosphingobium pentaromativorans US6-1 TaxID=1088721 RepID=G6EGN5_9SPHN|nr:EamA family transporter [Novosphingobium pentaromativorans]AIT82140.1 threonine transporter [Novosphingobium pentaromativorans US6-1]EHJ59582.1 protein of unknown function DUF6 transmembrane [Novosphingobium pentaromativorans US6-1]
MKSSPHLPAFAAFGSLLSLQVGAAFAKSVFPLVGPEGVAALRIGLAACVLGLVFRPWQLRIERPIKPYLLLYAAMIGSMTLLIYRAFSYMPVGIAIAIEVIGPLGAALIASRRRIDLVWIGLALAGLGLLPFGTAGSVIDPRGLAFVLAAALCWGIYVSIGAKVSALGAKGTAIGMALASLFVIPIGVAHAGSALFHPNILLSGLVVAAMSSALPFLLDIYALRRLPASVFGVLMSASPAVSAIAGMMVLGEHLSAVQWAGIGFITVACIGTTLVSARLSSASRAVASPSSDPLANPS